MLGGAEGLVNVEAALNHIRKRRLVLGGVVLSGGEPCLYEELPALVEEIKKTGLPVKLDTNGTFPAMLENLFRREESRPDYIALDLKIAPARYAELIPPPRLDKPALVPKDSPGEALTQSAALIHASGIEHEYRTLALPGGFITGEDIEALAPLADNAPWHFRHFREGNCLDPAWDILADNAALSEAHAKALVEKAISLGKTALFSA